MKKDTPFAGDRVNIGWQNANRAAGTARWMPKPDIIGRRN